MLQNFPVWAVAMMAKTLPFMQVLIVLLSVVVVAIVAGFLLIAVIHYTGVLSKHISRVAYCWRRSHPTGVMDFKRLQKQQRVVSLVMHGLLATLLGGLLIWFFAVLLFLLVVAGEPIFLQGINDIAAMF